MSLFTEPVDRFFVGKIAFGLLFVGSFFKALQAVLIVVLRPNAVDRPWGEVALTYGLSCLLWLALFRVVEGRRRVAATKPQLRAS